MSADHCRRERHIKIARRNSVRSTFRKSSAVSRFVLTRQWLSEALIYSDTAVQVTLRGDEMRAVLRAAWKGMGYADPPIEVFHHAPGENPDWLRYHRERGDT